MPHGSCNKNAVIQNSKKKKKNCLNDRFYLSGRVAKINKYFSFLILKDIYFSLLPTPIPPLWYTTEICRRRRVLLFLTDT